VSWGGAVGIGLTGATGAWGGSAEGLVAEGLSGAALGMGLPTADAFGILAVGDGVTGDPSAFTGMALTGSRGGAKPFGVCWAEDAGARVMTQRRANAASTARCVSGWSRRGFRLREWGSVLTGFGDDVA
jgi:hypothetical protein